MNKMIQDGIDSGVIVPIDKLTVFDAGEIERAFRLMASAKHMGKIVLKIRDEESPHQSLPISCVARTYFNPKLTYIIVGGLGGFGLELADWMVLRGCRKIVFSSSRGISKPYQEYRINVWKSYGVEVFVSIEDITTATGCLNLIEYAEAIAPVGGIFNSAVLLRDNILINQDAQKYKECLGVKAWATKYLDAISRNVCKHLEHFVVFSSVSCGRGNAGQSNYGMANSIMERIVEKRNSDGLPGKAIQW